MALQVKLTQPGTRRVKNRDTGEYEDKTVKGGTVAVYGLNAQFPVSLYPNQWKELFKHAPAILAFIKEQEDAGNITERVKETPIDTRVALAASDGILDQMLSLND